MHSEAGQYLHTKPVMPKPRKCVKWKPLDVSCYKTNFDEAVFAESGEAGNGVVIRNSNDEVISSLSKRILNPSSITLLELLGARRAALFISEVGLDNSILEGDSEIVINVLKKGELFNSSLGHMLKDTVLLVSSFKSWSFSHKGR